MKKLIYRLYKETGYFNNKSKETQRPYIKFFKNCHSVLELGPGKGTFLEFLAEHKIKGVGVENNKQFCEYLRKKGLNVIYSDMFKYLKKCKENSYDGIFASHLVEHLSFEKSLELFKLSYRVLKLNGKILIATPNVKSLGVHLNHFYRDPTHVAYYHPEIIEFLLKFAKFFVIETGENPLWDSPLFSEIKNNLLLVKGVSNKGKFLNNNRNLIKIFKEIRWKIERLISKYVLRNQYLLLNSLINILEKIDRPSECYVYAEKK